MIHKLSYEAGIIPLLTGLTGMAIDNQVSQRNNPSVDALLCLLDTMRADQATNAGAFPEIHGSTAKPWYEHTTWEDSIASQCGMALIESWQMLTAVGGKAHDRVERDFDPIGMAFLVLDNAAITLDALGYLPGKTVADDPTTPAQGRPHIDRYAADTDGTRAALLMCNKLKAATGARHPVGDLLVESLESLMAASPSTRPMYMRHANTAVYRDRSGKVTFDSAKALPGYQDGDWDGVQNQIRDWRQQ